jgi:hypothetical protein
MVGTRIALLSTEKKVKQWASIVSHDEVTKNVSARCRRFGISRATDPDGSRQRMRLVLSLAPAGRWHHLRTL